MLKDEYPLGPATWSGGFVDVISAAAGAEDDSINEKRASRERAASMIEYALILSLIAVFVFAAVSGLGRTIGKSLSSTSAGVDSPLAGDVGTTTTSSTTTSTTTTTTP